MCSHLDTSVYYFDCPKLIKLSVFISFLINSILIGFIVERGGGEIRSIFHFKRQQNTLFDRQLNRHTSIDSFYKNYLLRRYAIKKKKKYTYYKQRAFHLKTPNTIDEALVFHLYLQIIFHKNIIDIIYSIVYSIKV